jgi:hypothetical protein
VGKLDDVDDGVGGADAAVTEGDAVGLGDRKRGDADAAADALADCVLGLYGTPEMRTLSMKTEPELNVRGTNLTVTPE